MSTSNSTNLSTAPKFSNSGRSPASLTSNLAVLHETAVWLTEVSGLLLDLVGECQRQASVHDAWRELSS